MENFTAKAAELAKIVWAEPLYRGALLATAVFVAILLIYWIIRIVCFFKFGKRRCVAVTVEKEQGNIVVFTDAVTAVLRDELKSFAELDIRRIIIFRKRDAYFMELRCNYYKVEKFRGLPELFSEIEPLIKKRMKDIFGMENISAVDIRIDNAADFDDFVRAGETVSEDDGAVVVPEKVTGK